MSYFIVSEAQKNLRKLVDQVSENHEPAIIKGKKHTAVLISSEDWEDIKETLFVASNKKLSDKLLKGLKTDFSDCSQNLDE